ncbi:MAG: hypothetical protein R3D55_15495 [Chloroflexota bacterium]
MSGVWVFLENKDGKIVTGSREAVSAARTVADGLGQQLTGLVFGEGVSGVADAAFDLGVDAVLGADDATLASFRVEAVGPLVTKLAQEHNPSVILASASSRGRDLAAWVAADLDAGLVSDGVSVAMDGDSGVVTPRLRGQAAERRVCHQRHAGHHLAQPRLPAGRADGQERFGDVGGCCG